MAGGRTHDYGTLAAAALSAAFETRVSGDPTYILVATLGAISGLYISPDLDMPQITRSEARLFRLPVVGIIFVVFWYPYSLIPHRSIFSHLPILGTALRLLYLFAMGWVWMTVIESLLGLPAGTLQDSWTGFWRTPIAYVWARGLALSDLLHWLLDGMPVRLPT